MDHVYKSVEITGSSTDSIEDAVRNAVTRTSHSVRNMRWFQVTEIRGSLDNNHVDKWQVTLKLSFDVDEG